MSDQSPAPAPVALPTSDQEFVFESIDAAPAWVDKSWASFDRGPALAVPAGDALGGPGPYTTKIARVGDTVKFVAAKGATAAHFEVVAGEPDPATSSTKKPPQQSAASLEDMLKNGVLSSDDLAEDAKAQVAGRSPHLAKLVEDGTGAPAEPQSVADILKTS